MDGVLKKRITGNAVGVLLLAAGSAVAAILAACGVVPAQDYSYNVTFLCMITLCFLFSILIVEIVSVFKISDSTAHTVYIAASTLGFCLFSNDFITFLAGYGVQVDIRTFDCLNFAFFVLLSLALIYFWNYTYNLKISKRTAAYALAGAAACIALYAWLVFVNLQIIALIVYGAGLFAAFAVIYVNICKHGRDDLPFYFTEAYFFAACGCCLADTLCGEGVIKFTPLGFASFYACVLILIFALIYVAYAMRTDKTALEASEYKLKYERVRSEALRGQIKPHFIFNSLAAIQSLYHRSLEAGDRATSLFSRHLRANVEAANTDLIPFERELDNIEVYVDLENMRYDRKFNVIFDIDYADFDVPVLSLQPYIENAMRYSRVNEKPDGYIKISTRAVNGGVVLEVSDNGVGFDPDGVPASSCGIRNSRERFEVLMGVEPEIFSKPGGGATVSVFIPLTEANDEDNNS